MMTALTNPRGLGVGRIEHPTGRQDYVCGRPPLNRPLLQVERVEEVLE
jgi:hypothetical protein